jgi:hypothetical protein
MARDERRRQKKLDRKRTKRREALAHRDNSTATGWPNDPEALAALPVQECWLGADIFQLGIGQAVVGRTLSLGRLAVGTFLLDVQCLGIKNAFGRVMTNSEFREHLRRIKEACSIERREPAYVTKLIFDLEAWARRLGFPPHADYQIAKQALAGIRPEACTEQFAFGKDGKPLYVSGPFDRPFRVQRIIETLRRTCGEGNYHYVVAVDSSEEVETSDLVEDGTE